MSTVNKSATTAKADDFSIDGSLPDLKNKGNLRKRVVRYGIEMLMFSGVPPSRSGNSRWLGSLFNKQPRTICCWRVYWLSYHTINHPYEKKVDALLIQWAWALYWLAKKIKKNVYIPISDCWCQSLFPLLESNCPICPASHALNPSSVAFFHLYVLYVPSPLHYIRSIPLAWWLTSLAICQSLSPFPPVWLSLILLIYVHPLCILSIRRVICPFPIWFDIFPPLRMCIPCLLYTSDAADE